MNQYLNLRVLLCCAVLFPVLSGNPANAKDIEIDVLGLFKDAAMLSIGGVERMLRSGERSEEGVLLISSNSREAVIQIGNEQHTLNLSSRIGTTYQQAEMASVSVLLNEAGQYRTSGTINGRRAHRR